MKCLNPSFANQFLVNTDNKTVWYDIRLLSEKRVRELIRGADAGILNGSFIHLYSGTLSSYTIPSTSESTPSPSAKAFKFLRSPKLRTQLVLTACHQIGRKFFLGCCDRVRQQNLCYQHYSSSMKICNGHFYPRLHRSGHFIEATSSHYHYLF